MNNSYSKIWVITPVPTLMCPSLSVNRWLTSSGTSFLSVSVRDVSSPGITICLSAQGRRWNIVISFLKRKATIRISWYGVRKAIIRNTHTFIKYLYNRLI